MPLGQKPRPASRVGATGTPPPPPQHLQQPQTGIPPQAAAVASPFPKCASDVLVHVSEFVKQRGQNPNKPWNRVKVKELQNLIDQDLFCLAADRRSSRLNPLQHFRLLGIVCTYFQREVSKEADPQLRYLHFDIIFCGREGEALLHEARVQFLVKVCSLATQYPVYDFFEHVVHWLSKVASDDLKRAYAEQIVAELVEGFVLAPAKNKMYEYLLPLVSHSFDFCANFIVFSIHGPTVGPELAQIVGPWLSTRVDQFLHSLSQSAHLSQPFCAQKFDLLLRYDCSAEATPDDNHDRLHFVLIEIATKWAQGFVAQQPQKRLPLSGSQQQQQFSRPIVNNLVETIKSFDSLPSFAQTRLLECLVCCIRAGFLPQPNSCEPICHRLSMLDPKELAGPMGTLWQSLALLVRAQ